MYREEHLKNPERYKPVVEPMGVVNRYAPVKRTAAQRSALRRDALTDPALADALKDATRYCQQELSSGGACLEYPASEPAGYCLFHWRRVQRKIAEELFRRRVQEEAARVAMLRPSLESIGLGVTDVQVSGDFATMDIRTLEYICGRIEELQGEGG